MVAAPFKNQSLSLNTPSPSVAEDGFREERNLLSGFQYSPKAGSISLASEVSQYSQSSESTVDQTFSFRLVIGSASSSSSGGKLVQKVGSPRLQGL